MSTERLRLLFVSLQDWPQSCRTPKNLTLAGFDVSVFTSTTEAVNLSRFPVKFFRVAPESMHPSHMQALALALRNVCASEQPHFILPADELSVTLLNYMEVVVNNDHTPENQRIAQLVLDSRGSATHHQAARNKLHAPTLAREAGLQTPVQVNCNNLQEALAFAETHAYPVVMKQAYGNAGVEVSICHSAEDIQAAWPDQQVAMQTCIEGSRHYCSGLAYRGKLVCANTFEVLQMMPDRTGPSSVIRSVHLPTLEDAAHLFVEHIGLSGVFSLDFMVTTTGACYFMECNPRCTPATALGNLAGNDLFEALFEVLQGRPVAHKPASGAVIAFFPNEYKRNPTSPYLWQALHDVPWDEPALLRYYLSTLTPDAAAGH